MIRASLARRALRLLAAASLAAAAPAAAVPVATPAAPATPSLSSLNADQVAFGQWLVRLNAIERPMQESLASVAAGVQSITAAADVPRAAAAFRPSIAGLIATVDSVDAELNALDTPDFPSLGLPADLRPAAIKAQAHQLNRNVRTGFQNYLPVLDAVIRRDLAAARRAMGPSMASMQLMLESQLLMLRASQAPIPRETSLWDMVNVEVLYHRVAVRLAQAWPANGAGPSGAGVARGLLALAGDLERTAAEGDAKAQAELAEAGAALAEAERAGNEPAAAILRRRAVILTNGRAFFPLARDLAALLRRDAPAIGEGPMSPEAFVSQFQRLYPFRDRILEADRSISAGLAGPG